MTAGASFVARSTVYHVTQLDQMLGQAIAKKGFGVVEVLSPCHTNYGRQNRLGSQVEMMKGFKKQAVRADRWDKVSPAEREGRFPIGVLADHGRPTFWETYEGAIERAQAIRKEG